MPTTEGPFLADVVPSLLAALDVPGFADPLGVEPARRVCLLVIDGLGLEQLRANSGQAPFLSGGPATTLAVTTHFPATTVASLGSLGTGLPPGEHGLVGTTVAVPGQAQAMSCLRWAAFGPGPATDLRDRVPPERFQPERTAFERAAADRVEVSLVGPRDHARSGLTRAVLRGGRYESVHSLGELAAVALGRLAAAPRTFVYAYHRDLDRTGHVRGVSSDNWRFHLGFVDRLAEQVAERLPRDGLLAVVGDHGMVDLRPEQRVDLADQPELAAGVRLLTGEARARHVHTGKGAADDVLAAWRALLGGQMWIVPREQAIGEGWFGPRVADRVRPRIGDVVAAARGPVGVFQREVDPGQAGLVGHHGGLTPAERLVPLILFRR
ncbi:MAG TPA: alkaline phosphatase family protein [Actinomycetes bacterium]|nr:alkaline phosphatase family protein [Actinomycetes bacterium]